MAWSYRIKNNGKKFCGIYHVSDENIYLFSALIFLPYNGTNKHYVEWRFLHLQVDILLFSSDLKSDICLLNVTDIVPITGCGISVRSNPLIFGGQSTAAGQWPWHVALFHHQGYDTIYKCGGSFVGTRTIITGMFMYCLCIPIWKN